MYWTLLAWMVGTATAEVFPYDIASTTLDNGLDVHIVPTPSTGVVAYYTWMSVGSRNEVDKGRTGFAHFFEHLMFKGTETLPPGQREQELMRMGAKDNAWTWFDDTVYHTVLPTSGLQRIIELEADRFQNLTLTADDVQREAGAVYGEFRKSQASPRARLEESLYATAFTTHTYGHDTIGYPDDIRAMPTAHEYAMTFFDRHYRPEHAALFIVGDVDPTETLGWVKDSYSTWQPGTVSPSAIPEEPLQEEKRTYHVDWPTPTAPRLAMGWKIPAHDPDNSRVADLELAAKILLSDVGPLHRRLLQEEHLAFEVSGGRNEFVDPGLFRVFVTARDGASLDRIEAIVLEEVANIATTLPPEVVDNTRSHVRYAFLTNLAQPNVIAGELGWSMRRGGSDAINRFYTLFDAVTPQSISETVTTLLIDERLTVVTLSSVLPTVSEPLGGDE